MFFDRPWPRWIAIPPDLESFGTAQMDSLRVTQTLFSQMGPRVLVHKTLSAKELRPQTTIQVKLKRMNR
jgi:hypothetical protein